MFVLGKSFDEHWGIISIFLGKYSPLANLGEMGTILAETTCLPENNMDIEFDLDKLDMETGNPTVLMPGLAPAPLPSPCAAVQGNPTAAVVIPNVQDLLLVIEQKDKKIEDLESKLRAQEDVDDMLAFIFHDVTHTD